MRAKYSAFTAIIRYHTGNTRSFHCFPVCLVRRACDAVVARLCRGRVVVSWDKSSDRSSAFKTECLTSIRVKETRRGRWLDGTMNSKNISFSHLKLIEEVKKRPQLYNNDRSINREEKMKLWREVGAAIFSDWSQLKKAAAFDRILFTQKKWRSFRDAYNREVRAQKTGIRPNRSVYKYFKPLLFLGGFDGNPDDIADREYFDAEPLENADESSGESSHDPLINITPKKEKIEKVKKRKFESSSYFNNEDDHEEDQIPVYTYEMEKESNDTDSDKLFLLSFVPEMKQLPLNIKMWARAQISNVMQEAINSQYNNTTPGKELKIFGQDTSE